MQLFIFIFTRNTGVGCVFPKDKCTTHYIWILNSCSGGSMPSDQRQSNQNALLTSRSFDVSSQCSHCSSGHLYNGQVFFRFPQIFMQIKHIEQSSIWASPSINWLKKKRTEKERKREKEQKDGLNCNRKHAISRLSSRGQTKIILHDASTEFLMCINVCCIFIPLIRWSCAVRQDQHVYCSVT